MSLIINTPFVCPAKHWVEGKGGKLKSKPKEERQLQLRGPICAAERPALRGLRRAQQHQAHRGAGNDVNTIRARVDLVWALRQIQECHGGGDQAPEPAVECATKAIRVTGPGVGR